MEMFRIHFWTWPCLTNAPKLSESKYQAGFGAIISGQNPLTFMIPIYSTTVLYDSNQVSVVDLENFRGGFSFTKTSTKLDMKTKKKCDHQLFESFFTHSSKFAL